MLDPKLISGIERQNKILHWINQRNRISIGEVCEYYSVSEATARRDLEALASQGKIQRVHGGAIAIEKAPPEMPMLQRQVEQMAEKQRIGIIGAQLVKDGDTIFLGSGTSVYEVARNLKGRRNLTIITNSLPVINLFSDNPQLILICIGGLLRPSEFSFIGHIAEQTLSEIRVDKVFIGVRAINFNEGLSNDYLPETLTDRAILRIGKENIVVADHTKFGRTSTVLLVPISHIHTLITGVETPDDLVKDIMKNKIKVLKA
jgi:DeoR/GlpR family transcriptional regulator of sugar metabolism